MPSLKMNLRYDAQGLLNFQSSALIDLAVIADLDAVSIVFERTSPEDAWPMPDIAMQSLGADILKKMEGYIFPERFQKLEIGHNLTSIKISNSGVGSGNLRELYTVYASNFFGFLQVCDDDFADCTRVEMLFQYNCMARMTYSANESRRHARCYFTNVSTAIMTRWIAPEPEDDNDDSFISNALASLIDAEVTDKPVLQGALGADYVAKAMADLERLFSDAE